jgi:sugar transferase (PEP-CTERM/EpsH1 system associated)
LTCLYVKAKLRILVLGSEIPATASMPGSPRLFNLCRRLAVDHQLALVAINRSTDRLESFRADPAATGVFGEITVLPEPPEHSWWRQQVHRLRQEASFVTRSRNPEYFAQQRRRILEICSRNSFDVIYADGLPVSQYVPPDVGCPAVIDLHDCFTLLFRRTIKAEARLTRKLAVYAESESIARLERSLSRAFSAIIFNSEVDEAYFRTLDTAARTRTIGNGVDSIFFAPGGVASDPSKLVFTGVMDYGPNEDAAVYFVQDVLPLIRRRHPEVEFWIVGKDPTERVRALTANPGVHVTGGVPDVRPHIESAGIFVCPLRFGTGVKNKLLAALAMDKAVVATPLSLEGLDLKHEEDLLLGGTPEEFAESVVRLIRDPGLARRLAANGQGAVRSRYSWERSAALMDDVLRRAAAGAT